mmetsp:Transcript_9320/g.18801  ORF Transcript_9320/g.18801 Transcript_9320/m.18801 type:complete len:225 (+) Transcript_9320:1886-2560(+)
MPNRCMHAFIPHIKLCFSPIFLMTHTIYASPPHPIIVMTITYSVQSGKNNLLNAFLLKQVAKQVSSVAFISTSISIAPSPSASHFFIIASILPIMFSRERKIHGTAFMAVSSSDFSSCPFWLVSRYLAAQRITWGRDGHDGSSSVVVVDSDSSSTTSSSSTTGGTTSSSSAGGAIQSSSAVHSLAASSVVVSSSATTSMASCTLTSAAESSPAVAAAASAVSSA